MRQRVVTMIAGLCSALLVGACAPGVGAAAQGNSSAAAARAAASSSGAASAATSGGVWGKAEQVPGLAALAGTGDAGLNSVSCASAGNCSAGGFYHVTSRQHPCCGSQAFVVSQVNGAWGKARTVPGIVALNKAGKAEVTSVSCGSAGNCSAGGYYGSEYEPVGGVTTTAAFVVSQVKGRWGKAREVPGAAALNTGGQAQITSVSCASAGNCSAGGYYEYTSGGPGCCQSEAFVVSQVTGAWGNARKIPGSGGITSVSCASAGNCSAAGGLVVSQVSGTWGPTRKIVGTAVLRIKSVSCATPGNCSASGYYTRVGQPVVVSQVSGSWGTAREIAGAATLIRGGSGQLTSVSCASAGNCTAGGLAGRDMEEGSSTREFAVPYVVIQRNGAWGHAVKIPGIGILSKFGYAVVTSVSCATPRICAAGGSYSTSSYNPDGSGPGQAFVVSKVNGTWRTALDVTTTLSNDGPAQIISMACPAAARCTAAGNYWLGQQQRAFVVSQTG